MKPCTTESLLWCITWTLAFPVISQSLLFPKAHVGCHQDDDDDSVWYYLAFHRLWNKVSERNKMKWEYGGKGAFPQCSLRTRWGNSLGYGEITEGSVFEIVHRIRGFQRGESGDGPCRSIQTVIDLGSGSGRVVLAAALALRPMSMMGFEIVPTLYDFSYQLLHPWKEESMLCHSEIVTALDLRCCDFTVDADVWITNVDLIFVHGTLFEDALWDQVVSICSKVRVGTWVVSVSRPLVSSNQCHGLVCRSEFTMELSWGRGMIFLYVRS